MSKLTRRNTLLAALAAAAVSTLPILAAGPSHAASVSTWEKVAQCESGGNWSIDTGNSYYGGLQFSLSTWDAYGGQQYAAYPNQATEDQQILIGEKVLAAQGQKAWPTCGPAAGLGADTTPPFPTAPPTSPPPAPAPALGDKGSVLGLGTSPTAYTFTRDAVTGHLQVTTLGPGGWATKDLTSSVGTPVSAGGAPAAFVQQGGTVGAVTADAANGHLQITFLSTAGAWATADLTASVGTPVTGGALSTVVAPDGTLYIFSRGSTNSGHLSATYLSGTGGGWATADMTTMVGTPASAGGAPSTFLQTNGTLGVTTADSANGHLQITYLPKGGNWATSDLTASVGTPVTGGALSTVVAADGTLYIFSRGSTNGGHLSATYLNTSGTWATADMTNQVGTPASAGGAPSTFLQTNGTLGVATADAANGHLQITYLPKGGNWATSDLTTSVGTPVTGGALSAMTDADGTLAIYSIGSTNNGDVQLTYLPTNGTWTTVSMTTTAGTPHAG
ncbi:hypothetical protein ABIA33_004706 [Streptacidiphilus sp. MAP12-16]|uniref:transglycosylase family protein n=1 Tax=Streptacidiphilus sp. MAP12-16 TaxID=3156300 RepID=UPI003511C0C2